MKPSLRNRRVVEVNVNQAWNWSLENRVYSCPDTESFERVLGATALILTNDQGTRIPLEVSSVVTLTPNNRSQSEALSQPLRARLEKYEAAIRTAKPFILEPEVAHRFYFLGEEPWPDLLQALTTSSQCSELEWASILSLLTDPDHFFAWPMVGRLLWQGCTRGNSDQRHQYPTELLTRLLRAGIQQPDVRNNGPAIMSFLLAGGKRPSWGNEGWPIHHIYDGPGNVPHACSDPNLFTHSAGLVAVHPAVHYLAHKSELLKWILRREAFLRFGFDPMKFFSSPSSPVN